MQKTTGALSGINSVAIYNYLFCLLTLLKQYVSTFCSLIENRPVCIALSDTINNKQLFK